MRPLLLLALSLLASCAAAEQDISDQTTGYLIHHAIGIRCTWPGPVCRPASFQIPNALR